MDIIKVFQNKMKIFNIDAYIIPTGDFHNSEYVSDYFKGRQYLSGFTGSAGTLLVTLDKSYLWTDGRYFIQAAKEIEGRNIVLMKQGTSDPSLEEFLMNFMLDKQTIGFDGRVLPTNVVESLKSKLPSSVHFVSEIDLIDQVWVDRPKLPFSLLYKLDIFFSGKEFKDKLKDIRILMEEAHADIHVLSSLEDQAWLFNLRGNDVLHTPVFLAYTVITSDHVTLYVDTTKIDLSVEKYLDDNQIIVKPYFEIYETAKVIKGKKILLDLNKTNYQLYSTLSHGNSIIAKDNPSLILKSIKNETEIKNTKVAHVKDGVAMTKFMYYIKNAASKGITLTEISASDYLESLRREDKGLVDLSFNTICGYGPNAAMMHYSATEESNATIKEGSFLLVDSGGHYLEGTTDVTRTYSIGSITQEMKQHYTAVLKANIRLARAIFLNGCTGQNLDILARGPIWDKMIDYKCGTGHGVGYLLSVHEGPNGFRWQTNPDRKETAKFQPGMITTNEPGIYIKDKYGIRIENEMLCIAKETNEYGNFLGFETITYCPIDIDPIQKNLLTFEEKEWLNTYHQKVYDTISPYLTEEEKVWLEGYTKKI